MKSVVWVGHLPVSFALSLTVASVFQGVMDKKLDLSD